MRGSVRELVTSSPERRWRLAVISEFAADATTSTFLTRRNLRFKTEILRETLRRLGRIDWTGAITGHASPPWGYRNRAQWKVRPQAGATNSGAASEPEKAAGSRWRMERWELDIFARLRRRFARWRNARCFRRGWWRRWRNFAQALAKGELPVALREVTALRTRAISKVLVNASFAGFPSSPAGLIKTIRAAVPGIESLLLNDLSRERMELDGPGYLKYDAGGFAYRVGHYSFFQVNRFLVDELVRTVLGESPAGRQAAGSGSWRWIYSAGVGLFTRPLAERMNALWPWKQIPRRCGIWIPMWPRSADTWKRAKRMWKRFLREWKDTPDLVVLDPPRAGMTPEAVARLAEIAPAEIAYVSCEPSTLARDLAVADDKGILNL